MRVKPTDEERLHRLIEAKHACISIVTSEEDDALMLLRAASMSVDVPLWVWSVTRGVHDGLVAWEESYGEESENPIIGLHQLMRRCDNAIVVTLDLGDHLDDPRILRVWRECVARVRQGGGSLVMIDHRSPRPDVVHSQAIAFELSLPDEDEIERIVRCTLREANETQPIKIDVKRGHYNAILGNLRGMNRRQVSQIIRDVVYDDRQFSDHDLARVLARKREILSHGGLLEFIEAPVDMDQIGGIRRLRRWLADREHALSDEATEYGIAAPRGVLMLGVQGAGKSLCAKAIATAWRRPLLRMDVGALYDRYVGESERRLRDALHQAESMAPIILWIDEIEKAFASAASQSTDGGLSKRMFGTLLTWMQDHRSPVFLVATANDIEALPPELMRKGRFDEIFFVDLPGEEARRQIAEIHLRKRDRNPKDFDVDAIVQESQGFSGAEIEQAILSAMHAAFAKKSELTTDGVIQTMRESPPLSVTMSEKIERLRRWADGRCVPAD